MTRKTGSALRTKVLLKTEQVFLAEVFTVLIKVSGGTEDYLKF